MKDPIYDPERDESDEMHRQNNPHYFDETGDDDEMCDRCFCDPCMCRDDLEDDR